MRISLLALITLFSSAFVFAGDKFDERLNSLVLRARVLEAKIDRTDARYPRCLLKIEATFTNEGNEPIIILRNAEGFSGYENFVFSSGVSILGANRNGDYPIQDLNALPSNCGACNEKLGKLLDLKTPPDKYAKILKPGESITLVENSAFGMPLKTSNGFYGWDEIEANDWKIFGKINYSMFPINLGKYGEDFGHKLQKRWKDHGILYVGDTHSLLTSEKFEIDLSSLKF